MTLDEAIRRNPYNPKKGNEAAYCRYLRYNVEGWYQFDSKEVLRRWQKVRKQMQIVVNISEEDYEGLKKKDEFNDMYLNYYEKLIVHGTPLPKGHGAIKDVSQIEIPMCEDRSYERWVQVAINAAPTIIEADRSEES